MHPCAQSARIAADMGLLGQPLHPAVWDAILPVARALLAEGIRVGTLVTNIPFARNLMAQGFTYIACGVDTVILSRGADAVAAAMRAE